MVLLTAYKIYPAQQPIKIEPCRVSAQVCTFLCLQCEKCTQILGQEPSLRIVKKDEW